MVEGEPNGIEEELYHIEDEYLGDEVTEFEVLLAAKYIIDNHFARNPDHGILAMISITEDLPADTEAPVNVVPLLTIGLMGMLEYLNKDLNTLGMSRETSRIKKEVWERYGKGKTGVVEAWEEGSGSEA